MTPPLISPPITLSQIPNVIDSNYLNRIFDLALSTKKGSCKIQPPWIRKSIPNGSTDHAYATAYIDSQYLICNVHLSTQMYYSQYTCQQHNAYRSTACDLPVCTTNCS